MTLYKPLFFHAHLLYVKAENPLDGEILMPGPYEIECWTSTNPESDPLQLQAKIGGPIHGANGSGAEFQVQCMENMYFVIFAYTTAASTQQVWERITSDYMWESCNQQEGIAIHGFAKFHLIGD